MTSPDPLARWIAHLSGLDPHARALPDRAQFEQIARELDLDDDVLRLAQERAAQGLARGEGHLRYGRLEDAIRELERAHNLAPWQLESAEALARAHAARYRKRGHIEDRQRAEQLAHLILEVKPDHGPAFAILNGLEATGNTQPLVRQATRRALLLGGALLALSVGGGLFYSTQQQKKAHELIEASFKAAQTQHDQLSGLASALPSAPPPVERATLRPLPFEVLPVAKAQGAQVEILSAVRQPDALDLLKVGLRVTNRGTGRLRAWSAKLVQLDLQGRPLASQHLTLAEAQGLQLHPEDQRVLHVAQQIEPETARVRLEPSAPQVVAQTAEERAGSARGTPACLRGGPANAEMLLDVRLRGHGQSGHTHWFELAWSHRDVRPLSALTLRPLYLDGAGQPMRSARLTERMALSEADLPPLMPQERRVARFELPEPTGVGVRAQKLCFEIEAWVQD